MASTFYWDTQSDWDNALSRSQVVTAGLGARRADEIWQGFDPAYSPYDSLASYWPLDETSGSTAADVVGANDGSIESASLGYAGVLSSNAYDFNGSPDHVATSYTPPDDGVASTAYWVKFDSTSGDQICGLNDGDSTDPRFYLGLWNGDLTGGFGSTAGGVSVSLSTGTWYHFALTGDGSTARVYLDGSEVTSFSYTFGSASIGYYIGARNYPSGPSRYIDGRVSDVMVWNRALSASEVQTISDTRSSGALTTNTRSDDNIADQIEITATVPSSTSADVTLYQDTNGGTNADNQETVSVADGTNTYSLSSFEAGSGADYWAGVDLSSSDPAATTQIDRIEVTATSDDDGGDSDGSSGISNTETAESTVSPLEASVKTDITVSGETETTVASSLTAGEVRDLTAGHPQSQAAPLTANAVAREEEVYIITDYLDEGDLIDPVVGMLAEPGETIEFPPGTYRLGSFYTNVDDLTLVAPHGDVTIQVIGPSPTMLELTGDGWRIEGFEFDFRERDPSLDPKQIRAHGSGWEIRDCVWRGAMEWSSPNGAQAIEAQVDYASGQGRIRGCYFPDGAEADDADASGQGQGRAIYVTSDSIGHVQVQRSWFEHWADGALDARDGRGRVSISSSYVRNTTSGIRVNGPAQIMSSTFVCDGPVPTATQSGYGVMALRLAGDRRTDRDTVYIEDCDFCWFSAGGMYAGHPIDDHRGVEHLQLFDCRIHNETGRASFHIGGGSVDIHLVEISGLSDRIKQTGGYIGTEQFRESSGIAADETPPIPEPPIEGERPNSGAAGDVTVGKPGGSTGRFYGPN